MDGIPIQMSKNIVNQTLDRLRPDDIFNIFVFANGNGQLWQAPQPNTPMLLQEKTSLIHFKVVAVRKWLVWSVL